MLSSLVQILTSDGKLCGAGFACLPKGLLLTCCHVVADAVGISRSAVPALGSKVNVTHASRTWQVEAELVAASSVAAYDLALLRINERDFPSSLPPLPVFDVPLPSGTPIRIYGYPEGYPSGVWTYGVLKSPVSWNRFQIEAAGITPGFSGAPVQELQMGRVIGLVSASDFRRGAAFICTASEIRQLAEAVRITSSRSTYEVLTDGLMGLPGDPLVGLEQFLAEYLGSPEHPVPFGGRDLELHHLDEWLMSAKQAFGIVSAPAGRGKSALLTRWAASAAAKGAADVGFVPVSNRFGTSRKAAVLSLLGKRLRFLCGGEATQWPSTPDDWLSEINVRLRQDRSADRPLLIVIDGLDEAADWVAGTDVRFPTAVGRNVKILVSARVLGGDPDENEWLRRLHWEGNAFSLTLSALSRAGIQQIVRGIGVPVGGGNDSRLVDELLRLSGGDPLLVGLYVDGLRNKDGATSFVAVNDLPEIPPGLEGLMGRWMEDQRHQWEARGENADDLELQSRTLLYLLSFAFGPLSNIDIGEIAPAESGLTDGLRLKQILRIVSRFVSGEGNRFGYVFSHPRLRDYFRSHVRSATEHRSWHQQYVQYGERTVAALKQSRLNPSSASRYIVQHYSAHLKESGAPPEAFYSMVSFGWMNAWFAIDGSYGGFLNDISLAWTYARASRAKDVEIRCALCHSSTVSLSSRMSPDLLFHALRQTILTQQQVLSTIERMDQDQVKAQSLLLAAPLFNEEMLEHALDLGRSLSDHTARLRAAGGIGSAMTGGRRDVVIADTLSAVSELRPSNLHVRALAAVTQLLPFKYQEEALRLAFERSDEDREATFLSETAWCLNPQLLDGIVQRVATFRKQTNRQVVLLQLAPGLGRTQSPRGYAARLILEGEDRARYMALLSAHSGSLGLAEETLDLIRRLGSDTLRAELLSYLTPHIPDELLQSVLASAQRLLDENLAAQVLYSLANRGTPDEISSHIKDAINHFVSPENYAHVYLGLYAHANTRDIHELVKISRAIRNPIERCHLLSRVLHPGPQDDSSGILSELFMLLSSNLQADGSVELVSILAPLLPPDRLEATLRSILLVDGNRRDALLSPLLPHLSRAQLIRIVESVQLVRDIREQAIFFAAFAGFIGHKMAATVIEAVTRIDDDQIRAIALSALAPRMATAPDVQLAQSIASEIHDNSLRAKVFTEFALVSNRAAVYEALLAVAGLRSSALIAELLGRLSSTLDDATSFVALDIARTRLDNELLATVLPGVIPRLPRFFAAEFLHVMVDRGLCFSRDVVPYSRDDEADPRTCSELMRFVSTIPVAFWRISANLCLLSRVTAADQSLIVDLVVKDLPEIESVVDRSQLIIDLLRREPPQLSDSNLTALVSVVMSLEPIESLTELVSLLAPRLRGRAGSAFVRALEKKPIDILGGVLELIAAGAVDFRLQWAILSAVRFTILLATTWEASADKSCSRILAAMAPHLRYSPLLPKAVRVCAGIRDPSARAVAYTKLAKATPLPHLVNLALSNVKLITGDEELASALTDLSPHLSYADAISAFEIARGLSFAVARQRALRAIRARLPLSASGPCVLELLRTLEDVPSAPRAAAIIELGPVLGRSRKKELLPLAWSIWDEDIRCRALADLPFDLSGRPALAALGKARSLVDKTHCAKALVSLAREMRAACDINIFSEAFGLAVRIPGTHDRIETLQELWRISDGNQREVVFSALTSVIRALDSPTAAQTFSTLSGAPAASAAERAVLISSAWECVRDINPTYESLDGLDNVWPQLIGDEASQAWRWSWGITKTDTRRHIQALLRSEEYRLPDEHALTVAYESTGAADRFNSIWDISLARYKRIPEAVWPILLRSLELIGDPNLRHSLLQKCLTILPGSFIVNLISIAKRLPHSLPSALDMVSPLIRQLEATSSSQLIDLIEAELDGNIKADLITSLGPHLLPEYGSTLVRITQNCNPFPARVRSSAAIWPFLQEAMRLQLAADLIHTASSEQLAPDVLLSVRDAVIAWGLRGGHFVDQLWDLMLVRAASQRRPAALVSLSVVASAAAACSDSVDVLRIGNAVKEICEWWS